MFSATLTLLLVFAIGCDSIEEGWKTIRPLSTTKDSVQKLLGNPEIDENGYYGYVTEDAYVQINYSSAPCKDNQYKRGIFNVPTDTVISYTVNIKKAIQLSELNFKKDKYFEDSSGDVSNFVDLVDADDGIVISITIRGKAKYVRKITYAPDKAGLEKYKCVS